MKMRPSVRIRIMESVREGRTKCSLINGRAHVDSNPNKSKLDDYRFAILVKDIGSRMSICETDNDVSKKRRDAVGARVIDKVIVVNKSIAFSARGTVQRVK